VERDVSGHRERLPAPPPSGPGGTVRLNAIALALCTRIDNLRFLSSPAKIAERIFRDYSLHWQHFAFRNMLWAASP
jgi:hypothetical protein